MSSGRSGRGDGGRRGRGGGRGRGERKDGGKKQADGKKPEHNKKAEPKKKPPAVDPKKLEEERQKKEEAKKAAAEAKKKLLAEEKARKAKDEAKAVYQQAVDLLQSTLSSYQQQSEIIQIVNDLATHRQNFEKSKKSLKTDLKKCTALVKKVKVGTNWEPILKDIEVLNLSRYVEEVASALMEAKPKMTDLPQLVQLVVAMHQRYPTFLESLLPSLWNQPKRLYVRWLTELMVAGVVTDTSRLEKLLQEPQLTVAFGKSAGYRVFGQVSQSVVEAMATARTQKIDEEKALMEKGRSLADEIERTMPKSSPSTLYASLGEHCHNTFESLSKMLVEQHAKLQALEKRCAADRLLSGTLTEAREKGLEDARQLVENIKSLTESLADMLVLDMPLLREEEGEEDERVGGIEVWTKAANGEDDLGPFDDEETRDFYTDVPDLLTTVPPALLGMSETAIEQRKVENVAKYGGAAESDVVNDEGELEAPSEDIFEAEEDENDGKDENLDEGDEGNEEDGDNKDTPHYRLMVLLEQELPECHRREDIDSMSEKFCTNHGSSKNSRKRLGRTLFLVPFTRLDLLPYYSRMTATLDRIWPDIASTLVMELEQQFHGQAKFKKNQNIESRMRTARYIGELTKFRVAPPIVFLRCLRRCLDDFTGNNVDVACCLLETCGRFLHRLPHTTARVQALMDAMTNLGKAKHLDERAQGLMKAAFYSVKPPPSGPRRRAKEYPPLETYLRHLLLTQLDSSKESVSAVTKQILAFPWSDPASRCGFLVCRIMLKACRRGRYNTINAVVSVAAGLRAHKASSEASTRLIDAVLEELQFAMEYPNFKDQQRIVVYARLLGELLSSVQVSPHVVFDQLFAFINYGHEIPDVLRDVSKKLDEAGGDALPAYNATTAVAQTIREDEEMDEEEMVVEKEDNVTVPVAVSAHSKYDPRVMCAVDPPESSFRIKLACTLLECAARSLVSRNNLSRLFFFLTAFQRYLFTKTSLPADIEFMLLDTFDVLDSQLKRMLKKSRCRDATKAIELPRYSTWLDAHNATIELERSFASPGGGSIIFDGMASTLDNQSVGGESVGEDDDAGSAKESIADEGSEDSANERDADVEMESAGSDADEGSEGDLDDEEEEFDQDAYMKQLEEEAFERELRRITMEALDKGKNVSKKQVAPSMPSGSQTIRKRATDGGSDLDAARQPLGMMGHQGVSFQLLKRGNKGKLEAKELVVPSDTNLARAASKQDDAAMRERDVIKQRVLQYEADSAEAELTGGNVYLEQEKLQVIRNKNLSMDDIDRNFGTTGGNLVSTRPSRSGRSDRAPGRGRGGGRGRSSSSGRSLFRG